MDAYTSTMRSLALLLLLTGCSDGRAGFDILQKGQPLSLEIVYQSPEDPWPQAAPTAGAPPQPPRRLSLKLIPGMPVPRMVGQHWTAAYQFDPPQARVALDVLDAQGFLGRVEKEPYPPPPGPSYLLRVGVYDPERGGFHSRGAVRLGSPAETRKVLQAVRTRLTGQLASDVEAFLAGVKD